MKIRGIEVLGKTELVSLFLDRRTDVPSELLTEAEVRAELEDKLQRYFGEAV